MKELSTLLDELVQKKMQIEQFKTEHPELAEMVQMVEEYFVLYDELYRLVQHSLPVPLYPMYPPYNPLLPPWTCGTVEIVPMGGSSHV